MDTRVLQEQRLEAIAQIKNAKLGAAASFMNNAEAKSYPHSRWLINARQNWTHAKRHVPLHYEGNFAQQLDDRAAAESAQAALRIGKARFLLLKPL